MPARDDRPLLIFVSDIHLTDVLHGNAVSKADQLARFNGHSHVASMQPLGRIDGKPAVYFNTGTWRAAHQIGHDLGGRPSFLPYDAMSYLVFFPDGDKLGREYEWWTGASVARHA